MLRFIFVITTILSLSFSGIIAKDLSMAQGNFSLRVNGTNGNVAVSFKDEESLSFNFLSLIEKQSNGTAIDSADPKTHSFSSFSASNYTVSDFTNGTYQNLTCFSAEVKSALIGASTLSAKIHYLSQEGKVSVAKDLTENVQVGSVILSVTVEGWKFCANTGNTTTDEPKCNSNATAIANSVLDFAFDVAGKQAPVLAATPARGGNYTFNQSFVYFAPYYLADDAAANAFKEMPVGFPLLTSADSKNTFTVRFDKAAKALKWDALLVIRRKDVAPTPPTPTPTPAPFQNASIGNYSMNILGKSGKININYNNENRLTFEFNKLAEVFANGTEIEKTAVNHTVANFANLDFEISNFTAGQYQNLSCVSTNIKLRNFFRRTALDASLYIFNQSGLIKTGVQVVNGTNVNVFENVLT